MQFWKIVGVSALVAFSGLPGFAEIDAANLTCGDFMALPNADRDMAAQAVIDWANAPGSSLEGCLVANQVQGRSVQEVHQWMEARCNGRAVDDKVVAELCQLQ